VVAVNKTTPVVASHSLRAPSWRQVALGVSGAGAASGGAGMRTQTAVACSGIDWRDEDGHYSFAVAL